MDLAFEYKLFYCAIGRSLELFIEGLFFSLFHYVEIRVVILLIINILRKTIFGRFKKFYIKACLLHLKPLVLFCINVRYR